MRLAIVADAGPQSGLGHVGRCLALAQALWKTVRVRSIFHVADMHARLWIKERGFPVQSKITGSWDTLIVDSYRLKESFYRIARKQVRQLLCFDDLGQTSWPCDWVLNSGLGASEFGYDHNLATGLLLGPRFHALRQEFWSEPAKRSFKKPRRILLMLGGGMHEPLLQRLIRFLLNMDASIILDVVTGPMEKCQPAFFERVRRHSSPFSLRPLMESCDLAITGAGQTLYELARLGVPTIAIQIAANQAMNAKKFEKAGTCLFAGESRAAILDKKVYSALSRLIRNPLLLKGLSENGRALVDGLGALRVARLLTTQELAI